VDSRGRLSPHFMGVGHFTDGERYMRQAFYRRQLPHLQRDFRPHFVTFCTYHKWVLPQSARQIALDCCLHDHNVTMSLYVSVVMPDHVHMIFTPLVSEEAQEIYSLASIMDAIKGASSHKINRALGRKGRIWQAESFDHVLRSSESLDAKIAYVLANPVRRGLASRWEAYPWLWRRPD
jgi:REP element-mobilizing transposase RayT